MQFLSIKSTDSMWFAPPQLYQNIWNFPQQTRVCVHSKANMSAKIHHIQTALKRKVDTAQQH